jgi:hypothetical protein
MSLLRTAGTALVLTASAVVVLPAATATAATTTRQAVDPLPTQYVTGPLGYGVAPLRELRLDPLSNTGVDPLDNALGSQVADFRPVSTAAVTGPITSGGSLATLPLVGPVTGLLPH